jgi:peptidoglycan/xylan/chitin deacetylase (PgdA/CDA1 family)
VRLLLRAAAVTTVVGYASYAAPAAAFIPFVRRRFPGLSGVGQHHHVALTFDDGPDPQGTPRILDELDAANARATFFLLGEMVERAPDVAARLAADGHEIALHGWHHRNSLRVTPWALRSSLRRAMRQIEDATGQRPTLYRPPYGVLTLGTLWAARSLGLRTVLWGAWGKDWTATATPSTVLSALAPELSGGATVLLHDSDCTSAPGSWRATLGSISPLVQQLRDRDLTVGPLRDHGAAGAAAPVG